MYQVGDMLDYPEVLPTIKLAQALKRRLCGTYEDSIPLVKRSQDVRNLAGEVLEERTSSLYGVYRGI